MLPLALKAQIQKIQTQKMTSASPAINPPWFRTGHCSRADALTRRSNPCPGPYPGLTCSILPNATRIGRTGTGPNTNSRTASTTADHDGGPAGLWAVP